MNYFATFSKQVELEFKSLSEKKDFTVLQNVLLLDTFEAVYFCLFNLHNKLTQKVSLFILFGCLMVCLFILDLFSLNLFLSLF